MAAANKRTGLYPSGSTETLLRGWVAGTQGVQPDAPCLGTATGVCSPLQKHKLSQAWCELLDFCRERPTFIPVNYAALDHSQVQDTFTH